MSKYKGMPIYGVNTRPYEHLSDKAIAARRRGAIKGGTDLALIVALNSEVLLRKMVKEGAKIMPTPRRVR